MIATRPEYQRQGHARRLLEVGLKMADDDEKPWYAGCWPESVSLYQKVGGFEYITEERLDMTQYGGNAVLSMKLFLRRPHGIANT